MIYKCKMCGGELDITGKENVCECPFCGVTQTIPNVDEEKTLQLYNRATLLLKTFEFDKASLIYEKIISDQGEQAEAYWGLCLCKYGIEYVDDPKTGKKIPTCHRTLTSSILKDTDYLKALELSDVIARKLYETEAKYIDGVQKKILEISKSEEPYDIFICYKETDEMGQRTLDSLIAEDIFDELTERKYKTFYSRISLEQKIGKEYEPIIFSAINSAKVMLVIGTSASYFNAPWVKNEWSRFLKLCNSGEKKYLIPCYKGMSPYEMPEEFVNLQAQDLNKLGYLKDLVKGIAKLIETPRKDKGELNKEMPSIFDEVDKFIALGNFKEANKTIKKLDTKYDYNKHRELYDKDGFPIDEIKNEYSWYNFLKFKINNKIDIEKYYGLDDYAKTKPSCWNDVELLETEWTTDLELKKAVEAFQERCKSIIREDDYNEAVSAKLKARTSEEFKSAFEMFNKLGDYKDSKDQAKYCVSRAIQNDDPKPFIKKMLVESIRLNMDQKEITNLLVGFNEYHDANLDVYKDYLLNLESNSESQRLCEEIKVLEEKRNNLIKDSFELNDLNAKKESVLFESKKKKENSKLEYDRLINDLNQKEKAIEEKSEDYRALLGKCGIFDFSEKKRLKQKINDLSCELIETKSLNKSKRENETAKFNNLIKQIESETSVQLSNMDSQISLLMEQIGVSEIDKTIESLNKKISLIEDKNNQWEPKKFYFIKDNMGLSVPCYILGKSPQVLVESITLQIELSTMQPSIDGIYRLHGLEFIKRISTRIILFPTYKKEEITNYYVVLPAKWIILDKKNKEDGDYFLLMMLGSAGVETFNNKENLNIINNYVTKKDGSNAFDYEQSDIRKWLNNNFYNTYFSELEKNNICINRIINHSKDESIHSIINDKVFLMSLEELQSFDFYQVANSELSQDEWEDMVEKTYKYSRFINNGDDVEYDQIDSLDIHENNYTENARVAMESSAYFQGPSLLRTTINNSNDNDIGPVVYGMSYSSFDGAINEMSYFKASNEPAAPIGIIPMITVSEDGMKELDFSKTFK